MEGWEVGSGGLHNGVDAVRATCVYLCTPECVRTLPLALRALATQEYVSDDSSGASTLYLLEHCVIDNQEGVPSAFPPAGHRGLGWEGESGGNDGR